MARAFIRHQATPPETVSVGLLREARIIERERALLEVLALVERTPTFTRETYSTTPIKSDNFKDNILQSINRKLAGVRAVD